MIDNDSKLLISELRSYNYLLTKLMNMTEHHARTIKRLDDDIARNDSELNEYHVQAVRYDSVAINQAKATKNGRVLELMVEQEQLQKRLIEIKKIQKKEVDKIVTRIDDIDVYLNKLNDWERQFITHMYIESRCIDYMVDTYNYSRKSIYNKSNTILSKMLYSKQNKTLHTV